MIHLRLKTEYSIRNAVGKIEDVIDRASLDGKPEALAITDFGGTWGHVAFSKACKKRGIKPIFGVELAVVADMDDDSNQWGNNVVLLARNNDGLKEIYESVAVAHEKFKLFPRVDADYINNLSDNVFILTGKKPKGIDHPNAFVEIVYGHEFQRGRSVLTCDNTYLEPGNDALYEAAIGSLHSKVSINNMHLMNLDELHGKIKLPHSEIDIAYNLSKCIAHDCNADLPIAEMVKPDVDYTLRELCEMRAKERGLAERHTQPYIERIEREIEIIHQKGFEDYFFVVEDMVRFAKQHMLVGYGRGSACGSLVCYYLGITEIDPLQYDLLFERFIDLNRADYPDIDIDFPDHKRYMVFDYLKEKYGHECVAQLGAVSFYKPNSCIVNACKEYDIAPYKVQLMKEHFEASDDNAPIDEEIPAIEDAFREFPQLRIINEMNGHVSHTTKHAAGILVTNDPITHYCSVGMKPECAQIDKRDAEDLNLLKIDALGLRTLSVIEDAMDQLGMTDDDIKNIPLNDQATFDVMNSGKFSGIFQFEGDTLKNICESTTITSLEDIISLTSLARPGVINSGGTANWIMRKNGQIEVEHLHDKVEPITSNTLGVIVYEEQLMRIARLVGNMSWPDISSLRRLIKKKAGAEAMDEYRGAFVDGCKQNDVDEESASEIWAVMVEMGAYAFNRSHAVAYGKLSYTCAWLKAHHPFEFFAACLRHSKESPKKGEKHKQAISILREADKEGIKFVPYDKELSEVNWSAKNGMLIGGLKNINGIAEKTAASILKKKAAGKDQSPSHQNMLDHGITPFDKVFEGRECWSHIYNFPLVYNITSPLVYIDDIKANYEGQVVFLAKKITAIIRNHNDPDAIARRGTVMKGQTKYVQVEVEDDTGSIKVNVNRDFFKSTGMFFYKEAKEGEWFLFKADKKAGFKVVFLSVYKKVTGNEAFSKDRLNETEIV